MGMSRFPKTEDSLMLTLVADREKANREKADREKAKREKAIREILSKVEYILHYLGSPSDLSLVEHGITTLEQWPKDRAKCPLQLSTEDVGIVLRRLRDEFWIANMEAEIPSLKAGQVHAFSIVNQKNAEQDIKNLDIQGTAESKFHLMKRITQEKEAEKREIGAHEKKKI